MKKKMDILYEDKNLLIINKPSKLLTIASAKERINTLYHQASDYVKKQYPKNKVFIVNRLDKDTSGIVVFAKNEEIKKKLQNHWTEYAIVREYRAIVEGKMRNKQETLKDYLYEDKTFKVHVSNKNQGDLAITKYQVLDYKNTYSNLKIEIQTGKKNQIRVQLSNIGNPIIGDKKYGAKRNPISRMGLHASYLELKMPKYKDILKINAPIPVQFQRMFEVK
ncbi:MAG: RNA pseudouridine synthase [Bacilli bacterium]|nr:RNA pseudouridine synthase [Bacilli bacterium]